MRGLTSRVGAVVAILILVAAGTAAAAPGDLDVSFGAGGIAVHPETGLSVAAFAIQDDGGIVAVGSRGSYPSLDITLTRFQSSGEPDTSFGTDGLVVTSIGASDEAARAEAVALQDDGKIVVAGYAQGADGFADFAVLRYLPNGDLDPTFGTDGIVMTGLGSIEEAAAVLLQPDGKILVGGQRRNSFNYDYALLRYMSDGALDPSFSGDGMAFFDRAGRDDKAAGLALLSDGSIVQAGVVGDFGGWYLGVVRYTASGSLDVSFGVDGLALGPEASTPRDPALVRLQADGKLVAAFTHWTGSDTDFAVARFTPNGVLDPTFAGDGVVFVSLNDWPRELARDDLAGLALDDVGNIVLTGDTGDSDGVAIRLTPGGVLDPSFGDEGIVRLNPFDSRALLSSVTYADGRVVAAGTTWIDGNQKGLVIRLRSYGPPEPPTDLFVRRSDRSIEISWSPPGYDGGGGVSGYEVEVSPGDQSCSTQSTSCLFTGLVNGQSYSIGVSAWGPEGVGVPAEVSLIRPYLPCEEAPAHGFSDVSPSSFAAEAISCLRALGVTTGTSPTKYSPTDPVTREQMAAFLARLYRTVTGDQCPVRVIAPFGDISRSFAQYDITCIYSLSVTTGTTPTMYSPSQLVTREQMAAFVARLYEAVNDEPCVSVPTPFTDVPSSSFASEAIGCLYGQSITTGTGQFSYSPSDLVTREQMATFVARLYKLVA